MERRLFAALATVAVMASVAPGCGSGMPPLLGNGEEPDAATPQDGDLPHLLDETGAPSCKVGPEGGVCGCLDLPLMTDPPNLYFVLDHSGSMNESDKWLTVRFSIAHLMEELGPRAYFGAALFPDPSQMDSCATGVEVAPLRRGDSPPGAQGPTTHALLSAIAIPAYGGTPTAATFASLTPHIASFHGRTFAILATDGGPNCDGAITCTSAGCTLNIENDVPGCTPDGATDCCSPAQYGPLSCLDGDATVAAVTALAARGVATYVIGVPGSAPYASLLDEVAKAGGTARTTEPYYYPVDSTDQSAFYSTLSKIAAKLTATCVLPLGMKPPDPSLINVYLDEKVVPQAGANGWTYADDTVTLLGTSCSDVLDGDVLDVRVVAGCPTIEK